MTRAYYNDSEPYVCAWLRNLIAAGHIAAGDVDERSITDVAADDLRGYTQCHFFAGIGGWSLALRLAGWPDARSVWTGSCPCQPFSAAGAQRGSDDDRHLWPAWFRLIRECRPSTVFGEQVAGAAGRAWLDHVLADLESEGYAAAAADLPACSVGAPHIRARHWFVAYSERPERRPHIEHDESARGRIETAGRLGRARHDGRRRMADADGRLASDGDLQRSGQYGLLAQGGGVVVMGDADVAGLERRSDLARERAGELAAGPAGPWRDLEWLPCSDGKARPTQPGLFPLAHGIPGRVGRLRAYGNAIVPQVAAEFIAAVMECRP